MESEKSTEAMWKQIFQIQKYCFPQKKNRKLISKGSPNKDGGRG